MAEAVVSDPAIMATIISLMHSPGKRPLRTNPPYTNHFRLAILVCVKGVCVHAYQQILVVGSIRLVTLVDGLLGDSGTTNQSRTVSSWCRSS